MSAESWFKISLPGIPVAFTLFGVWLYWGDNPISLLPPSIAFWGLMILFYLFSHLYIPDRRLPLLLVICSSIFWLVASITSHNLKGFLLSTRYAGPMSVLRDKDFWYAYVCSVIGCAVGVWQFFRLEPQIVAQIRRDRREILLRGTRLK